MAPSRISSPTDWKYLFFLAVSSPALVLGGNRFGLLIPTIILVFVLIVANARRIRQPGYASWLWLAVMIWGAAQVQFGLTPDVGEAARILVRYAIYAAIFLIAATYGRCADAAAFLIKATALWIAAISCFGLIAWTVGSNPVLAELEAYPAALEATFVNRNAFALYSGFGLMAALTAWRMSHPGWRGFARAGWLWLAAAAISALALLLTGSRGGVGATLIGLVVMTALMKRSWLGPMLATGALVCAALLFDGFERPVGVQEDTRFAVHALILERSLEAPLTGHGLGGFQDAMRGALGAEWRWGDWDHAHQQYLETAFELGWPAAIALFAAVLLAPGAPRPGSRTGALAWGALAASAAHAFVDFSLAIPSIAMTLALFLGLARGRL